MTVSSGMLASWPMQRPPAEGTVLDLACGSAPMRAELPHADWVGVDSSAGELAEAARHGGGPLIQARADALPVATESIDAVCASMCLPVPARHGASPSGLLGWARVMTSVRAVHQPWPNPHARDTVAEVLRHAGFRIHHDERRVFPLALETSDDAHRLVDGLSLPRLTPERAQAVKAHLARWARPRRTLPLPLRRVLATGACTP